MRSIDPVLTAQRRRQILDAALVCFREKGFHGAAMSAICKQAQMSPGHLYHYCSGKEDLIEAIVAEDSQTAQEAFALFHEREKPVEALLEALDDIWTDRWRLQGALNSEIMAEAVRNPRIRQIIRKRDERMRGHIMALLATAKSRGQLEDVMDPEAFARLLISLVQGLMVTKEIDEALDPRKISSSLRQMLECTLYGGVQDSSRKSE